MWHLTRKRCDARRISAADRYVTGGSLRIAYRAWLVAKTMAKFAGRDSRYSHTSSCCCRCG